LAEALARLDHEHFLEALSAGSRPSGGVHSDAVAAMRELGSDISQARSKSATEFRDQSFDVVVTVCDSAARDCPNWPNAQRVEHWPIEDPSYEPDPELRRERFRQTRDELRRRIDALARELSGSAPSADAPREPRGSTPR
jgi:arsenate reductase (thioredoxin)